MRQASAREGCAIGDGDPGATAGVRKLRDAAGNASDDAPLSQRGAFVRIET